MSGTLEQSSLSSSSEDFKTRKQKARASILSELRRRKARTDLGAWCEHALAPVNQTPAAHHRLLIRELEAIASGANDRLMIFMPPGSAKSTYASVLFPAWFLAQRPRLNIIGASHTADLAEAFSRRIMGVVRDNPDTLGYGLETESVGAWITTTGGEYKAAGVGGPITGRRADVAIIDDPVKPLSVDTQIPTPCGWTTMGELKVGDRVFDHAGKPCNVVALTPRYKAPRHRVKFSDGSFLDTHPDHLWMAFDRRSHAVYNNGDLVTRRTCYDVDWWKWTAKSRRKPNAKSRVSQVTTKQISETLVARQTMRNWTVPTAFALDLPEAGLPIDPYILGYWLGDGSKRDPDITVDRLDLDSLLERVSDAGYFVTNILDESGRAARVSISTQNCRGHRFSKDHLRRRLDTLGVRNNKHIPRAYLRASVEQRIALLRGLMDSDGTVDPDHGEVVFVNTEKVLADGVEELIVSLGGKVSRASRPAANKTAYILRCFPPFQPFHLARKAERYRPIGQIRRVNRTIVGVDVLEETEHLCITVDSESHLFLAGRAMIPTCNSRADAESPTYRDKAWNWFLADLRTRLKPRAAIVLIMTRWHQDDLGGRLLESQPERWRTLQLPARAGETDPLGREPGEWLWSDDSYGYGAELRSVLAEYENSGGMRDWWALYEQSPRILDGGIFKIGQLGTIDAVPADVGTTVRAWDLAATADTGARDADYTVGLKLAKTAAGGFVILDVVRFRGGPDEVEAAIKNTADRDGKSVTIGLPQDPGQAGKSQLLYLTRRLAGYKVDGSPESGDKAERAMPVASQMNVGNVAMVRANWNALFVDELAGFPSAAHDDQADALSRAFSMLVAPPAPAHRVNVPIRPR